VRPIKVRVLVINALQSFLAMADDKLRNSVGNTQARELRADRSSQIVRPECWLLGELGLHKRIKPLFGTGEATV
jgi:hypothetical protein